MDKYEKYAVSHYLTEWPEEFSFQQIFDDLLSGDEGMSIFSQEHYAEFNPEDLAYCIKDMADSLRMVFNDQQ